MEAFAPVIVEFEVTGLFVPMEASLYVADKFKLTISGEIKPSKVPVIEAAVFPSYDLSFATAPAIAKGFLVIEAVNDKGAII